jgi:hypothetical protein
LSLHWRLAKKDDVEMKVDKLPVMFLWNAYQIEVEVFGPGRTDTARNCHPDRACSFDEFIKHIEMHRNRPGFQGTTGVSTTSSS